MNSTIENQHGARPYPIVIAGHVDHGKSTLVGRLLYETASLPDGKLEELKRTSEKRGADMEWAFALDALQMERDQGITLDTTRVWFASDARTYVIIDAPGHKEFLRNMITGAAAADGAVLVVDAVEGLSEQTRSHAYLLALLGVRQVVVAVNKIDKVDGGEYRFASVRDDVVDYLGGIGIEPHVVLPLSAKHGHNLVADQTSALPWWSGPSLLEALDALPVRPIQLEGDLRLPVQDLYRRPDKRLIVGRIERGRVRVGDTLSVWPGGRSAKVVSLETGSDDTRIAAAAGQSIALTLDDELFVERGHVLAAGDPPVEGNAIRARLFWLDRTPLRAGDTLTLRLATASHQVVVERLDTVIDVQTLSEHDADAVPNNGIADVVLRSRSKLVFDLAEGGIATGRGALVRDDRIVGGFTVAQAADVADGRVLIPVDHSVGAGERAAANGHQGGVLWLTGLSGSGKSTLAMALQRRLFDRGQQVYVLDGDNIRGGLNKDLGFSPDDRSENIRRIAEAARLFADAGFIVVTAFISPYREDRHNARAIIGDGFQEVFVKAGLDACESRDPKGLYVRARSGEIPEFTGITAPYEEPQDPDLTVDTEALSLDAALNVLIGQIDRVYATGGDRERASG